jgi:hypothetical protein
VTDELRCEPCHRILVPRMQWDSLPRNDRKRLASTHAEKHSAGMCQRDYKRYGGEMAALGYPGEWSTGSLVRRGSMVRCPETDR